ncbi:MAG: transcriptional regulator NrdR [Thermoplasmatota archaeon]
MKCPHCGCQDTRVIDSRETTGVDAVRRRRQCVACSRRFTTYERWERPELKVRKRAGRIEDFDRDKLEVGLLKACQKRPISRADIVGILDEIEDTLRDESQDGIVTSARIGELALTHLQARDEVAYIRFASVYKAFGDASHFEKELKALRTTQQAKL